MCLLDILGKGPSPLLAPATNDPLVRMGPLPLMPAAAAAAAAADWVLWKDVVRPMLLLHGRGAAYRALTAVLPLGEIMALLGLDGGLPLPCGQR